MYTHTHVYSSSSQHNTNYLIMIVFFYFLFFKNLLRNVSKEKRENVRFTTIFVWNEPFGIEEMPHDDGLFY